MKRSILPFVVVCLTLFHSNTFAGSPPSAPVLTVNTYGIEVDLSWPDVPDADGYTLFYAFQGMSKIYDIDLGDETYLTAALYSGAALYVAIQAYNASGASDFSNIELIQIDGGSYQLGTAQTLPSGAAIQYISGSDAQCFDYSALDLTELANMSQCITACGTDPSCQMNCLSALSFMPESFAYLTMSLSNTTGADITLVLEQGTAFVPADSGTQTMIIAQDQTILIPASGSETVCLPVFCIDPSLSAPSDSDVFTLSGIAQKSCLQEILTKIDGKTGVSSGELQDIIWNCVDPAETVSQAQWDWLEAL